MLIKYIDNRTSRTMTIREINIFQAKLAKLYYWKQKWQYLMNTRKYIKHSYSERERICIGENKLRSKNTTTLLFFNKNKGQNERLFLHCVLFIYAIDMWPSDFLLLQHMYASVIRTLLANFLFACLPVHLCASGWQQPSISTLNYSLLKTQEASGPSWLNGSMVKY